MSKKPSYLGAVFFHSAEPKDVFYTRGALNGLDFNAAENRIHIPGLYGLGNAPISHVHGKTRSYTLLKVNGEDAVLIHYSHGLKPKAFAGAGLLVKLDDIASLADLKQVASHANHLASSFASTGKEAKNRIIPVARYFSGTHLSKLSPSMREIWIDQLLGASKVKLPVHGARTIEFRAVEHHTNFDELAASLAQHHPAIMRQAVRDELPLQASLNVGEVRPVPAAALEPLQLESPETLLRRHGEEALKPTPTASQIADAETLRLANAAAKRVAARNRLGNELPQGEAILMPPPKTMTSSLGHPGATATADTSAEVKQVAEKASKLGNKGKLAIAAAAVAAIGGTAYWALKKREEEQGRETSRSA